MVVITCTSISYCSMYMSPADAHPMDPTACLPLPQLGRDLFGPSVGAIENRLRQLFDVHGVEREIGPPGSSFYMCLSEVTRERLVRRSHERCGEPT